MVEHGAIQGRIIFSKKVCSLFHTHAIAKPRCKLQACNWLSCPTRNEVMKDDHRHFLALLGQPPARMTVEQAAWALNSQPHDIPILVAARLLKPLGSPSPNGPKLFAAIEVINLAKDIQWLAKATNVLHLHWRKKYQRKKDRSSGDAHNDEGS